MPKPTYCLSVFLLLLAVLAACTDGDGRLMRQQRKHSLKYTL